jgi:hypothetical protein
MLKGKSSGRLVAHDFQRERLRVELFGEPLDLPDLLQALAVDLQQEVTGHQSGASGDRALRHLDQRHTACVFGDTVGRERLAAEILQARSEPLPGGECAFLFLRLHRRNLRRAGDGFERGFFDAKAVHREIFEAQFQRRGVLAHAEVAIGGVDEHRIIC